MEEWKDISGYEGLYQISDQERIKSLIRKYRLREKMLKPQKEKKGYYHVYLAKNGKIKTKNIHRLVLENFLGPCPQGMESNHIHASSKIKK